jgi:hypothetical protein
MRREPAGECRVCTDHLEEQLQRRDAELVRPFQYGVEDWSQGRFVTVEYDRCLVFFRAELETFVGEVPPDLAFTFLEGQSLRVVDRAEHAGRVDERA